MRKSSSKKTLLDKPQMKRSFDDHESEQGRWAYEYDIQGLKIDIPAKVQDLQSLIEDAQAEKEKVIFWKSDEMKKYVNDSVQNISFDQLPFPNLCLCMIEEADNFANGQVYEVLRMHKENEFYIRCEQWIFEEFENKEMGDNHKLLEWTQSAGFYTSASSNEQLLNRSEFEGKNKEYYSHIACIKQNVSDGLERGEWDQAQKELNSMPPGDRTPLLGLSKEARGSSDVAKEFEDLWHRTVALHCSFNTYVYNLAPKAATYSTGAEYLARDMYDEEQETDYRVYVLGGGTTKTRDTGKGGRHSHRYDVRGHKRVMNDGRIITVKGHCRGDGQHVPKQASITKETAQSVINSDIRCAFTVRRNLGTTMRQWLRGLSIALITLSRKILPISR